MRGEWSMNDFIKAITVIVDLVSVKCSKCGTKMNLESVHICEDGKKVKFYYCPKCGHTTVKE